MSYIMQYMLYIKPAGFKIRLKSEQSMEKKRNKEKNNCSNASILCICRYLKMFLDDGFSFYGYVNYRVVYYKDLHHGNNRYHFFFIILMILLILF